MIYTDRSRIECFEKCPAKRFWQYEYEGRGLELVNDLMLDARIGTWVHGGIERRFVGWVSNEMTDDVATIAKWAGHEFGRECAEIVPHDCSEQLVSDICEDKWIVTALVYAWLRTKAHRLIADGEVIAVEKEMVATIVDGVAIMARPDILWRRKSDGTVFIRNMKTVRDPEKMGWREKWAIDMQTLSEPLAVDAWLGAQGEMSPCGGVIIDGLVTGRMTKNRETGLFHHDNPLVYAWYQPDTETFYPKFEWSCDAPHKMRNGHTCEGLKSHRLTGASRVAVAERYPGGIIAWIDYLIEHHPSVVEEMLIELPPILRSEYQMERWKRMVGLREDAIKHNADLVAVMPKALDPLFPMHTANGNCLMPGKCPCYELCHGSAAADPLASGLYRYRTVNHPQEKESYDRHK